MLWGPQEEPPSLARGFWGGFLEEMRPELSLEEHGSVSPVKKRGREPQEQGLGGGHSKWAVWHC